MWDDDVDDLRRKLSGMGGGEKEKLTTDRLVALEDCLQFRRLRLPEEEVAVVAPADHH